MSKNSSLRNVLTPLTLANDITPEAVCNDGTPAVYYFQSDSPVPCSHSGLDDLLEARRYDRAPGE